jgi:L-threonylcarbamoyladenylate synthase
MAERFDTADDAAREEGIAAASLAIQRGELVVLPTDTVYGVAADAFDPKAVRRLLEAKGRGRDMPPPVLIAAKPTLDALATAVPDWARALVDELWPGPLTLVCRQQGSLQWDLGDTRGTVAVRIPDDEVAVTLLARTGPLAVSSANLTGLPAANTADEAERMLGDKVEVILDGGRAPGMVPSTIIDATGAEPRVLRVGAVSIDRLNAIVEHLGVEVADAG